MKFLLDENLSKSLVKKINTANCEFFHVTEVGLRGRVDSEIATYAKKHKMILITKDLEFGNKILYPKGTHYGLIIIRLPYVQSEKTAEIISDFLASISEKELVGAAIVLEVGRYRIRK